MTSLASHGPAVLSGPAGRYAKALYSYATDLNRLNPVTVNLQRFGEIVDENSDLRRLLDSPLTQAKDAQKALRAIIKTQELGMVARRLVDVLIANRRLPLLRSVIAAYAALAAQKRGITTARVTSAHPLSDVQEQQLRARLIEMGHGSIRIEREVDPSLLGGVVISVGARLYDSSLKSRLQRLQYAMKGAA
jgi:F-type H+-transporting ATPase subunit delta